MSATATTACACAAALARAGDEIKEPANATQVVLSRPEELLSEMAANYSGPVVVGRDLDVY